MEGAYVRRRNNNQGKNGVHILYSLEELIRGGRKGGVRLPEATEISRCFSRRLFCHVHGVWRGLAVEWNLI